MITGLLLLTAGLTMAQASPVVRRGASIIDMAGVILLVGAVILLVVSSPWFMLAMLPVLGLTAATLNRHYGIAARRGLEFRLEVSWLSTAVVFSVAVAWLFNVVAINAASVVQAVAISLITVALLLHALLSQHLRRYRLGPTKQLSLDDLNSLPTVSLLIPARNESHALNDTLTKALQSTYPKLEVLVLDDCSHDKTPEIIREFAHDGARFVEGVPTPDDWLGRNWALQQLAQAANGELLVFADVDVKLRNDTIAEIVGVLQRDALDIASFVPADHTSGWFGHLLPQLTNFWLTLMPFRFLHARAAIGRCFVLKASALPSDQFATIRSSIYPIYSLAKERINSGKRYKFFFGRTIGLNIRKHYHSNAKSTIRSASPALANRFDVTVLLLVLGGVSLVPLLALQHSWWLAVVTIGLTWLLFLRVAIAVNGWRRSFSSLFWPLQLLHEMALLMISIAQYRYTDLYWKERQVCLPLLQAEAKLPDV